MAADSKADLTIPATLAAEIKAAADEEQRPARDVLRDAVIGYLENRRWRLREEDMPRARALGLAEDDAPLMDEYRRSIGEMIAKGLASARQGQLVDGDAVFVRIEAELDALDARQRK
jgi:hypothetical protein